MEFEDIKKFQREYKLVEACNVAKKAIYQFAESVAQKSGFEANDDINEIVEKLGGKISYFHLDEIRNIHGSIFIHDTGNFDVVLPVFTSSRRDRFTIAHELGHYFLHDPRKKSYAARQACVEENDRAEWEANWFAAGFLMPTQAFRGAMSSYVGQDDLDDLPDALAVEFGVSREAATIRQKDFEKNGY